MSKHWSQTFYTYVWVFNTGRRLSVCVRLPHNVGMMYDLGAAEHFSPTQSCPEILKAIRGGKTHINVISEKRHCPTDGTVDCRYQSEETSLGCKVDIDGKEDRCRSVSTRNGHHILLILEANKAQPYVFLRNNPYDLLTIA